MVGNTATFRENALRMVLGTAASQGILFLSLMLFARLYGPEAIGLQAIFVSVGGLLATLASLRLDLALVLERSDSQARWVGAQALLQGLAMALVVGAVVGVFGDEIRGRLTSDVESAAWLVLLPLSAMTGVALQVGLSRANRDGQFKSMVRADVLASGVFAVSGLLLWWTWDGVESLVISRQLAQFAAVFFLLALGYVLWGDALRAGVWRRARATWRRHRQFLIFNTPYSVVGAFARDVPIYAFSATGGIAAAAAYALARSVTVAPVVLFSSAVSRAFYKEAVDHVGTVRLQRTVRTLTRLGLYLGLIPFAWLSVWGDALFTIVLGASWKLSGQMAMALAPAVWMSLQTGWPERMFEVCRRQGVSFGVQLVFDMIHAVIIGTVLFSSNNSLYTVSAFSVSLFLFHVVYLFAVYRVAGYELRPLAVSILGAMGCYLGLAAAFVPWRLATGGSVTGLLTSALVAIALALGLLLRTRGKFSRYDGDRH